MSATAKANQSVRTAVDGAVGANLAAGQIPEVVHAVVTNYTAPLITVQQRGSNVETPGIRHLSSYTPAVNDVVILLNVGGDLWALGKLA